MRPPRDLAGQRFGRLTVMSTTGRGTRYGREWLCRCDCGKEINAISANLVGKKVRSCGCLSADVHRAIKTKHGKYLTPAHNSWAGMMARCHSPKCKDYPNWGGRGITVCPRWHDFAAFLADMGQPRSGGLSIDRVDNNRGYEPGNCRWATAKQQALNRRPSKNVVAGVRYEPRRGRWKAAIGSVHLGSFTEWWDAVCARKSAEGRDPP